MGMTNGNKRSLAHLSVILACLALFLSWTVSHFTLLTGSQNGMIRFGLGVLFSLLILLRPKPRSPDSSAPAWSRPAMVLTLAGGALALTAVGLIFSIRQAEWIGILGLLLAALGWALPPAWRRDAAWAVFFLYWVHPLPSAVFGALQLSMQRLSVMGSEWLLHMLNVKVWADGFVLRTGFNAFGVPEWCSGMRTATTVFLLAGGLGILKRLPPAGCLMMMGLAGLQALILNVVRISAMVLVAPGAGAESGTAFLHDTAGIIVLLAIGLVYAELLAWEHYRRGRQARRQELNADFMERMSEYPPLWRVLMQCKGLIALGTASLLLAAGLAYKSRPYHRAQMIRVVAETLRDSGNLEEAERAAAQVAAQLPNDEAWQLSFVQIRIIRGKYAEALTTIDRMPEGTPQARVQKDVLRAYSLMGLDRMDEAAAIVARLPEAIRQSDPRVAMILAELGIRANRVEEVTQYVLLAATWAPNTDRVRSLFPFLRAYRRWSSISQTDSRTRPHFSPTSALAAAEAFMNLSLTPDVARVTLESIQRWPYDPRWLDPLFYMFIKRGDPWEKHFGEHLIRCAKVMTRTEELAPLFEKCFQMSRPDLAWYVYDRLNEVDPSSPVLAMSLAQHANAWVRFQKRFLGFPSPVETETIDILPYLRLARQLPDWRPLLPAIPAHADLLAGDAAHNPERWRQKALDGFLAREQAGTLTLELQYAFIRLLDQMDRLPDVRKRLEALSAAIPSTARQNQVLLSEVLERHGDWVGVYETLRAYPRAEEKDLQLAPLLRLAEAESRLELGLAALHTAALTARLYPDSSQAAGVQAIVLNRFDSSEQALFALTKPRVRHQRSLDFLEARLLYQTERYAEAQDFCRSVMIPPAEVNWDLPQAYTLPPAELCALWQWTALPTDQDFVRNAAVLSTNLTQTTCPFLKDLMTLWLRCYHDTEQGRSAAVGPGPLPSSTARADAFIWSASAWQSIGRDRVEKAIAVNQLTILLAWQRRFREALDASELATNFLPDSPLLWRIRISLSSANINVTREARRHCPDDGEIWLSELTTRTQADLGRSGSTNRLTYMRIPHPQVPGDPGFQAWVVSNVTGAATSGLYSPATLARAAEYLLRGGLVDAGLPAAREAFQHARGLLPVSLVGMRYALRTADREWALACTRAALRAALRPPPRFYEKLVKLRTEEADLGIDGEMVQALRELTRADPDNPLWAQMLGYVRFRRGGWEIVDSMTQMTLALERGATNRTPFLIAAEASRLLGNVDRAADILRQGLRIHPDDTAMLNNLAYVLSFQPDSREEVFAILPRLEARSDGQPAILDTLATVRLRTGQFESAEQTIGELLRQVEAGSHPWFRARTLLAELRMQEGKPHEAQALLQETLKRTKGVPDEDILAANKILSRAETALAEPEP
jgi:exosortase/archaeosortase family protein